MRNAFADELTRLAGEEERLVLLSGDIGNRLFDKYKQKFSNRFFNCGVAEANMVGVAAGLALCGLRPVTYTIASFATIRCLEQIKIDLSYHNVPVIIVGVGGGLSYAENGATHQSCEDISCLRVLPNMAVICPGDAWEVRSALRAALKRNGPSYIRLGKRGEPVVHKDAPPFVIGKGIIVKEGTEVCLLSTGNMLPNAVEAARGLEERGVSTRVVSLHTVSPMDEELLAHAFSNFRVVATIEEQSLLGGMGGSVAEWLADRKPQKACLCRIGAKNEFLHEAGGQEHARKIHGLTPERIAEKVVQKL
ncbi:MAG: transketolase [Armatimonadetes bacterium]|nr:transketolase [Armatimonadota bacterium]